MNNKEIILKATLPLLAHKRESDRAGKHDYWSQGAHVFAERGATLVDFSLYAVALFFVFRQNLLGATGVQLFYRAGVEVVPEQIARLGHRIIPPKKIK